MLTLDLTKARTENIAVISAVVHLYISDRKVTNMVIGKLVEIRRLIRRWEDTYEFKGKTVKMIVDPHDQLIGKLIFLKDSWSSHFDFVGYHEA